VTVSSLFKTPSTEPASFTPGHPADKAPQGPRRPRLSFFRSNCQTAKEEEILP
jgi:hypothetical protein